MKQIKKPLISIIVTVYNLEKYVRECLDSLVAQTYKNIEIVVIDDGSTDMSGAICDEIANSDDRVKVIHDRNGGLTEARKRGIKHSTGEYVVFVDGDDWIDINTCEQFVEIITEHEPDIIIDGLIKEYTNRSVNSKNSLSDGVYAKEDIERDIIPYMIFTGNYYEKGIESYICSKAIRRDVLEKVANTINKNISFAEGGVWLYSGILYSKSIVIISELHYHYRMRENSLAMDGKNEMQSILDSYEILVKNSCNSYMLKECLISQIDYLAMFFLIWKRMDLFNDNENALWPYVEVKKDSRIVIFGAWRYGRKLIEYLRRRKYSNIVMVVDNNAEKMSTTDFKVNLPKDIHNVSYDYIILGSETYSVVSSMKEELGMLGINERILSISRETIDLDLLPDAFKRVKEKYV